MQRHSRLTRAIVLCCAPSLLAITSHRATAQQFLEQTATRFPSPNPSEYTNQVTIGDLDNDGDLDIVFANGGNFSSPGANLTQRVYINDGTGIFSDQSAARLNFAGICRGVELGDIDNDGDLDMVFAQDFERVPQLFRNNGSGFFTNITATNMPQALLSSSRAQFADIDNDGDLDLYITAGQNTRFGCDITRVYINNGQGSFADETAARHPADSICGNMDCLFGDIDGDFDLDVIDGARDSASKLYKNNGAGVFTGSPFSTDGSTYSYDFGDIDGDGDLDLLGANSGPSSTELLLLNSGTGAFFNASAQLTFNPTFDDNDTKFFDYDDDGDLDIIIARIGGQERVYTNNGSGTFSSAAGILNSASDSTLDVKVADLTGDGRIDIVTAQGESGNFQNRIYVNVTGPADSRAPRIIAVEQMADTTDTFGPYVVRASVLDDATSDRNALGMTVTLHYRVDGADYLAATTRHSGGQIYRAEIPGQPCGGLLEYYVSATDFAGNTADGDVLSATIGSPSPMVISIPNALPASIAPCTASHIDVNVQPCTQSVTGTSLHLRTAPGDAFTETPLTPLGGTLYRANLPAFTCADQPEFYFSAAGELGAVATLPADAPTSVFSLSVGVPGEIVLVEEDFENGLPAGWSQTGLWNVTTACNLSSGTCNDNPGTSVAYYGIVEQCNYDTGDIHEGFMTTPQIALPQSSAITMTYCSTFQRHSFPNGDRPELYIDNGATTTKIDDPSRDSPAPPQLFWSKRTVNLTPWAGQTVTLSFKFGNISATQDAFLGWQVDDVKISAAAILCGAGSLPFAGDMNADESVDGLDVQLFTDAALALSTLPEHVCPGDFDGDGAVTPADAEGFAAALLGE